jgi:hypothetical protein
MNDEITEILIHNFKDEQTLTQVREDYEDLEVLIDRERATNGKNSRRLAALTVLHNFQLQLVLRKLVGTPDKGGEPTEPTT